MKKRYAVVLTMALMFGGCGNKDESSTETKISLDNIDDMKQSAQDVEKNINELKKATPLSNEQLKELLPESMDGMNRKSYNITKMGFNAAEAKYDNDTKNISLSILDGAGSDAGAGMISMALMGLSAKGESESEHGYQKQFEMDDMKGFEEQERSTDGTSITNKITFIVSNRFLLTFEAQGIDMDKLKSIAKDSNIINKLEDVK